MEMQKLLMWCGLLFGSIILVSGNPTNPKNELDKTGNGLDASLESGPMSGHLITSNEERNLIYIPMHDIDKENLDAQKELSHSPQSFKSRPKRFIMGGRLRSARLDQNGTQISPNNGSTMLRNYWQRRAERRRLRILRRRQRWENFRKRQQTFFQNLGQQVNLSNQRMQQLNERTRQQLAATNIGMRPQDMNMQNNNNNARTMSIPMFVI